MNPVIDRPDVFSALLDTTPALAVALDAEGRILLFNRACEAVTGREASSALGRFLWEVVCPPDEAEAARASFATWVRGPFPATHDWEWTHLNGTRRLIHWRSTSLKNGAGAVELLIATGLDVTEATAAEAELKRRSRDLTERVKELRCLYGISRLWERPNFTLREFLREVIELVPPAWQFPAAACARIRIGDIEFTTANYAAGAIRQSSDITSEGCVVGSVEVCYRQALPGMGDEPFLPQERSLLDSIAERLGSAVAHCRAVERIVEYQAQLRSLASDLALTSERERRQIAQELHDQIGHSLANVKLKLGQMRKSLPGKRLDDVIGLLERTIRASRDLTFELSPPVLRELGLGPALEWLVTQVQADHGIAGAFADDRRPKPLREDISVMLFQAVRELLANTAKHSRANTVRVQANVEGNELRLEVLDDGAGFDPSLVRSPRAGSDGWGLFSIRERMAHLGVRMAIDSGPGRGTRVTLIAPLLGAEPVPLPAAPGPAVPPATAPLRRPISVLLAEDQTLTRAGLRSLLEKQTELNVVAEAADGEAVVRLCRRFRPDVVVMDIAMPRLNGIEATRRILAELPATKVIALSMHSDGQYVLEMLRAGASGYLLKDCAQEDLARAIRTVDANLTFLSPGLASNMASDLLKRSAQCGETPPALTPRELEVLKLLAGGQHAKAIASELSVSPKTIETHRAHIMQKLDIDNVAGLTRYAIRQGLVELDD